MAWNIDLVLMLRSLIGDLDKSKYTNERLKQIITIAAYNVNNASSFINTYTIDVGEISISPDPLANDPDFCSLTVELVVVCPLCIKTSVKNMMKC